MLNVHNASVWGNLTLLSLAMGREEEANRSYGEATRLGLDDAELLSAVGEAFLKSGKYDQAEASLRRSLATSFGPHTLCLLGDTLREQGLLEKAKEQFQSVLTKFPSRQNHVDYATGCISEISAIVGN